jgi:hypothetical protein
VTGKWYVTGPNSNEEIPATRGKSKAQAQEAFIRRQAGLEGIQQPWVWWEKQGFKVRRG